MTLNPQETLREIALQSQLLALGAALEGASAGPHGHSLARAAAELRKLAESNDAAQTK